MSKLTAAQEAERASWQYRAIEATKGNQSKLGTLLLAILGHPAKNPPWFGSSATINAGGLVVASFTGKDRQLHYPFVVCEVSELTNNFAGLADHLKLNDEERIELFRRVREWVARDLRLGDKTLRFQVSK